MLLTSTELQLFYFAVKVSFSAAIATLATTSLYLSREYDLMTRKGAISVSTLFSPVKTVTTVKAFLNRKGVLPLLLLVLVHFTELIPTALSKLAYGVTTVVSSSHVTVAIPVPQSWAQTLALPVAQSGAGAGDKVGMLRNFMSPLSLDGADHFSVLDYNSSDAVARPLAVDSENWCVGFGGAHNCVSDFNYWQGYGDNEKSYANTTDGWEYAWSNSSVDPDFEVAFDLSPYYAKINPASIDWSNAFSQSMTHPYAWLRDQAGYQTLDNLTMYWSHQEMGHKFYFSGTGIVDLSGIFSMSKSLAECSLLSRVRPYPRNGSLPSYNIYSSKSELSGNSLCRVLLYQYRQAEQDVVIALAAITKYLAFSDGQRYVESSSFTSNQVYQPTPAMFTTYDNISTSGSSIGLMTSVVMPFYSSNPPGGVGSYSLSCDLSSSDPCIDVLTMLAQTLVDGVRVPVYTERLAYVTYLPALSWLLIVTPLLFFTSALIYNLTRTQKNWFCDLRDTVINTTLVEGKDCNSGRCSAEKFSLHYSEVDKHVYILLSNEKLLRGALVEEVLPLIENVSYKGLTKHAVSNITECTVEGEDYGGGEEEYPTGVKLTTSSEGDPEALIGHTSRGLSMTGSPSIKISSMSWPIPLPTDRYLATTVSNPL
ncbi:hypothetical protein BC943DRAFT_317776 [Umbelopsis sp. AD052]|nr:hypothetical protein BC943DRAFT_317776 [Umbelopsis sp. AD052]